MIYLDANATTQVAPEVMEAMMPFLTTHFANPSAAYAEGAVARKAIAHAREQVAALIDCEPDEIIFMSGGTESNNAAIASAVTLDTFRTHFVISKSEHSAVLEFARRWVFSGRPVTELDVDSGGRVKLHELRGATKPGQTALVSIMWANNETGVIGPIEEAVQIAHDRGALFHTDAVQAVGKQRLSMKNTPVDYLSMSGHKFHAPKGVGALYVSSRVRFKPWMLGGGQEHGRRSGTENVAGIVGMGRAAELMRLELERGDDARVGAMRDLFESRVLAALPGTIVNGDRAHRLVTTSSLSFPGVESAGLLILLDEAGLAASAGSACHAGDLHPSHVLAAMACDAEHASCTTRFSWSRFNTMEETQRAADVVIAAVNKMRSLKTPGVVVMAE
jgi:cysteine desulfurase